MRNKTNNEKKSITYSLSKDIIFSEFYIGEKQYTAICNGTDFIPMVFPASESSVRNEIKKLSNKTSVTYSQWLKSFSNKQLLDSFITSGVIRKDLEQMQWPSEQKQTKDVFIELITNNSCNLGCVYCFEDLNLASSSRINVEKAKSTIDSIIASASQDASINVKFLGGEPLLNWPAIKDLAVHVFDESYKRGYSCSLQIQTNLTFIPAGFIDFVKKYNMIVVAGIDGFAEIHNNLRPYKSVDRDSYQATTKSLEELRKHGVTYDLRCTVSSLNVGYLPEIIELHKQLGARSAKFAMLKPIDATGRKTENLLPDPNEYQYAIKRFIDNIKNWREEFKYSPYYFAIWRTKERYSNHCLASQENSYVIDQFGDIYNCIFLLWIDSYNTGKITDLDAEKRKKIANELTRGNDSVCANCEYRFVCESCPVTQMFSKEVDSQLADKVRTLQCIETKTIVNYLLANMAIESLNNTSAVTDERDKAIDQKPSAEMQAADSQSAFAKLQQDWKNWVIQAIQMGCTTESMVEAMVKSGPFSNNLAQNFIWEVRCEMEPGLESAVEVWHPRPDVNTQINYIDLDRRIDILMTVNIPRIVVMSNVLSNEECDALIAYSEPKLIRSCVVPEQLPTDVESSTRTSSSTMFQRAETDLLATIEKRLAALANWPVEKGEGIQVLRYEKGEFYIPHFDWFNPDLPGHSKRLERGGQRVGTFVLYLSDVEEGGSTSFPKLDIEVRPHRGMVVFFTDIEKGGQPDPLTYHGADPVIRGVKWVATKWLRAENF